VGNAGRLARRDSASLGRAVAPGATASHRAPSAAAATGRVVVRPDVAVVRNRLCAMWFAMWFIDDGLLPASCLRRTRSRRPCLPRWLAQETERAQRRQSGRV